MSELTIRRNRGIVPYQSTEKTEKPSAAGQAEKTEKPARLTVTETVRLLMRMASQAESSTRSSRRTLQTGEAVLAEVKDSLDRLASLIDEAAGGGETDRSALQAELTRLVSDIERMTLSADAGGEKLFLDAEIDPDTAAWLDKALDERDAALPDWLVQSLTQTGPDAAALLRALGLDSSATSAELLAALMDRPLETDGAAGYLAALYLGAVIAGGGNAQDALDGLRQLLEKTAEGVPLDRAVELLTNSEFTSLADFQAQFTAGTAPGLEEFLTGLLLTESTLLPEITPLPLLAGADGMSLDLLMDLFSAAGSTTPPPETVSLPAGAEPASSKAPPVSLLEAGEVTIMGRDLSGVSVAEDGTVTISGEADISLQGRGTQPVQITGTGTVTLRHVSLPQLTAASPEARLFTVGESRIEQITLEEGTTLTIGGGGLLRLGTIRGNGEHVLLRLTGGAVSVGEREGEAYGVIGIPVVIDGPVSLAAQALHVTNPAGQALTPFDLVWKALLPGWSHITAMELAGRQAKMTLLGGDTPDAARLWLQKGDPSHGYPAQSLVIRGRDKAGQMRTRYAYLLWSQQAHTFQEVTMYPNPFTVTGGEADRDWRYEEETHTLHILTNQVTAIAGGAGTDANQTPFSGRIALADRIGELELTLGGVACRVSVGRAFSLGRENKVTLLLQCDTQNRFESGPGCAGLSLGEGTSLSIAAQTARSSRTPAGTLTAIGSEGGAGIGRDRDAGRDQSSHIRIQGGTVTASGGGGGAGIGGGKKGCVGSITIRGGAIAAAADSHAAAIGAGVQGACGKILITGSARIVEAKDGGIGACLLGGCGEIQVTGGADIGTAKLRRSAGIPLQTGEDTLTLPQFHLSARALQLDRLSVLSKEYAQAAKVTVDADRRWVDQLQAAYSALRAQLEQQDTHRQTASPLRSAGAADTLLEDMKRTIPLPGSQAIRTHGRRGTEYVQELLRK